MKSPQKTVKNKYDTAIRRRGIFLLIFAYLCALILMILGIIVSPHISSALQSICKWLLAVCCIVPILLVPLNIVLRNKFIKKLDSMQIGELQAYIISHRELADDVSKQKLALLKKWRTFTDLYAFSLSIFGFGIAFLAGSICNTDYSVPFCFLSAFFFLCTFSRIRFPMPVTIFEEDKTYVSKTEYPELYALTQKAADSLGCSNEIKIAILDNFNAGIGKINDVYSVQLGALLLNLLSREELYSVLLHEFAHVSSDDVSSIKEHNYCHWVCNGRTPHFLSGLTSMMFLYFDIYYTFEYSLYQYASSISNETAADQAMVQYGRPEYAASALLKIKYYDLYCWEKYTYNTENTFIPEAPEKAILKQEMESFKNAIASRSEDWNHFVDLEILARTASHPTLKMRLETFGISNPKLMKDTDSREFIEECQKAMMHVEELIYQDTHESYEDRRKEFYLDPKELVASWEAAGRPLIAEEYADVDQALRKLGRVLEANELCDRAISELTDAAGCYANFMKGCFLLHCYNEEGIVFIYDAIEQNNNYLDEGLDMIGEFCCLTGNQKELDIYREKGITLAQKQKDIYAQISVLSKNDTLVSEQLPDNLLEGILNYIHTIDMGKIQKIYLIRKVITEDFFTSVFVIQFDEQVSLEDQDKILHKIFLYLDTCSDWQFSLFRYEDVKKIKFHKIENSCVYQK